MVMLLTAGECAREELVPVVPVCWVEVVEIVELLLGAGDLGSVPVKKEKNAYPCPK